MTAISNIETSGLSMSMGLSARRSRGRRLLRLAAQHPVGVVALVVLLLLCIGAAFAQLFAPYSPLMIGTTRLQAPSSQHLLGTDRIGRDVFTRILYGGRVSLLIGFCAVGIGTLIGSTIGLLSGFVGGWFDLLVQRVMDVIMS